MNSIRLDFILMQELSRLAGRQRHCRLDLRAFVRQWGPRLSHRYVLLAVGSQATSRLQNGQAKGCGGTYRCRDWRDIGEGPDIMRNHQLHHTSTYYPKTLTNMRYGTCLYTQHIGLNLQYI